MTLNANVNQDKQNDLFLYDTLHLKPIPYPTTELESNEITMVRDLRDILRFEIKSHFFSTYPYYVNHESSKRAIRNHQSGNCIALSYGLQSRLKQRGYSSYLIPASVPKKYRMHDYSEFPICHVAVCVVIDSFKRYILDPAFYFVSPLEVKLGARTDNIDIYNKESYNQHAPTLKTLVCREIKKESVQNKSRKIEYDVARVSYDDHTAGEMWDYHLVNILNPDSSIGLKYLHMKKEAFLCIMGKNMVMKCMVKQKIPGGVTLMENGEYNTYEGVNAIPKEVKKRFEDFYGMKKYLDWSHCEKFEKMYQDQGVFNSLRLEFKGGGGGRRTRNNRRKPINRTFRKSGSKD